MRPEYANTFGLRKVANSSGELLEITLDASYKYMETAITARTAGTVKKVLIKEGQPVKTKELLMELE